MRKEENAPPTSLRKAIPQLRLLTSWGLWVRPSWPDHTMASIMNQRTWILMLQAEVTEKSFKKALSRCQCVDRLLNNNKRLEPLDTVTQNRYAKSTLLTRRFKCVCGQPSAPGLSPGEAKPLSSVFFSSIKSILCCPTMLGSRACPGTWSAYLESGYQRKLTLLLPAPVKRQ